MNRIRNIDFFIDSASFSFIVDRYTFLAYVAAAAAVFKNIRRESFITHSSFLLFV